jgi:hypothetical protein
VGTKTKGYLGEKERNFMLMTNPDCGPKKSIIRRVLGG